MTDAIAGGSRAAVLDACVLVPIRLATATVPVFANLAADQIRSLDENPTSLSRRSRRS